MVPQIVDPRQGSSSLDAGMPVALLHMPEGDFSEEALLKHAQNLLRRVCAFELARLVKVQWNYRLQTTAGLACSRQWLVTLNPRLIAFGMGEVDRTLRHELAHLLARHRAGRRRIAPHGPEWRQACRDLGLENEQRCHNLPLPRRRMQPKHLYRCANCQMEIWRVRPFRRAVACLKCCRMFNGGRYQDRFRFVKVPLTPPIGR